EHILFVNRAHLGVRLRERARWQITVGDPFDTLGQCTVVFNKFLDRLPPLLKWNEKADGSEVFLQGPDPLAQSTEVAFGAVSFPVRTAPLRPDQQHTKLGMAIHLQVYIDPTCMG